MTHLLISGCSQMHLNKNAIGLNRARRPHNAIFVSFTDAEVPTECLKAAKVNWIRCCLNENDRLVEQQMKKVGLQRRLSTLGYLWSVHNTRDSRSSGVKFQCYVVMPQIVILIVD